MNQKLLLMLGLTVLLACLPLAVVRLTGGRVAAEEARAARPPQDQPPIVSGKLVSVRLWEKPANSNRGMSSSETYKKGRVAVYEKFIIITSPEGERFLYPNDYYTNLSFRSE